MLSDEKVLNRAFELIKHAPSHLKGVKELMYDDPSTSVRVYGSFILRIPSDLRYEIQIGVPGRFLSEYESIAHYYYNILRVKLLEAQGHHIQDCTLEMYFQRLRRTIEYFDASE
jgi:hypothetical protein